VSLAWLWATAALAADRDPHWEPDLGWDTGREREPVEEVDRRVGVDLLATRFFRWNAVQVYDSAAMAANWGWADPMVPDQQLFHGGLGGRVRLPISDRYRELSFEVAARRWAAIYERELQDFRPRVREVTVELGYLRTWHLRHVPGVSVHWGLTMGPVMGWLDQDTLATVDSGGGQYVFAWGLSLDQDWKVGVGLESRGVLRASDASVYGKVQSAVGDYEWDWDMTDALLETRLVLSFR